MSKEGPKGAGALRPLLELVDGALDLGDARAGDDEGLVGEDGNMFCCARIGGEPVGVAHGERVVAGDHAVAGGTDPPLPRRWTRSRP